MEFDCTPAEEAVLGTLEGVLEELENHKGLKGGRAFKDLKVLVAGYNSGLLPCALAKAGAEVAIHVFDCHNARTVRNRIAEARLENPPVVQCTSQIPKGPYARAYFMATSISMTGELMLDQLEDIRENLAGGGELFAAIEGDRVAGGAFAFPGGQRREGRGGETPQFRVRLAGQRPWRRDADIHFASRMLLPSSGGPGRTRPRRDCLLVIGL